MKLSIAFILWSLLVASLSFSNESVGKMSLGVPPKQRTSTCGMRLRGAGCPGLTVASTSPTAAWPTVDGLCKGVARE